MYAQLIEKLDRRRYKHLLWQTIGFALLIPAIYFSPTLGGMGFPVLVVIVVWVIVMAQISGANERRIKRDPELRRALNNELIVLYRYKSRRVAYWATLITALAVYLISATVPDLTARLACLVIIYVAGMSQLIAQLVYFRR